MLDDGWMRFIRQRRSGVVALFLVVFALAAVLLLPGWVAAPATPAPSGAQPGLGAAQPLAGAGTGFQANTASHPATGSANLVAAGNGVLVGHSLPVHVSPALRDLKRSARPAHRPEMENENEYVPFPQSNGKNQPDPVVQRSAGAAGLPAMPNPLANWEGMGFSDLGTGAPPDTNGEVGPNHYVQMVNSSIAIWDKQGTLLVYPFNINEMWSNYPTEPCAMYNEGDPVVLYDQLADRWLLSQFNFATDFSGNKTGPYYECVAVSQNGDATGNYWLYTFALNNNDFEDYPKLGVWPDGYYMGMNQFDNGQTYAGPRPYVFDRAKMLQGQTAGFQTIPNPLGPNDGFLMPADLDGPAAPPAGSPNYFIELHDTDHLMLYKYHVDWVTPTNSQWTGPVSIPIAHFNLLCPNSQSLCIPQPGTTQKLDGLGGRLMFRLAYRNFGAYESLVVNHSADAGNGQAGVRWYEIRNPRTTASVYQQGTFAPADGQYRWMGSVAMDKSGDLAVGYSVSSSSVYPSIRYTGRLGSDPLGTLPQGEATLMTGTGSQLPGVNRWGDYSDITVDPADDCTFWYTTEYMQTSGDFAWNTRIGSFKFPSCGQAPPPPASPTATPRPQPPTATPRPGATATATPPAGTCQISFTDVPAGSPFYTFVQCLACQNIVGGYSDGSFRPGANVTRGQLAKFVSNAAGYDDDIPPTQQTFTDVPPSNPFWLFIERVAAHGVVGGYADGTFRPGANVTRGQVAKFVSNAADYQDAIPATRQTFGDVPHSDTFWLFIERVYAHGVVGGYSDGTFHPTANVTRGQTSKFISNTFFPNCQVAR